MQKSSETSSRGFLMGLAYNGAGRIYRAPARSALWRRLLGLATVVAFGGNGGGVAGARNQRRQAGRHDISTSFLINIMKPAKQ